MPAAFAAQNLPILRKKVQGSTIPIANTNSTFLTKIQHNTSSNQSALLN